MRAYKIEFRWWLAENTGIAHRIVFAKSEQEAKDKFNETNYDCPIRGIVEVDDSADVISGVKAGKNIALWSDGAKQPTSGYMQREVSDMLFNALLDNKLITIKNDSHYPKIYVLTEFGEITL